MNGNKPVNEPGQLDAYSSATIDIDVSVPDYDDDGSMEVGDGEVELSLDGDDPSRPLTERDIRVGELASAVKHEEASRKSDVKLDIDRMLSVIQKAQDSVLEMPKMLYAAKEIEEARRKKRESDVDALLYSND